MKMERKLQQQIAFYLTGRREGRELRTFDSRYRPALLARYADLSTLRYDFPLVLNREGPPERALDSLSRMVDDAVEAIGNDPDRDRDRIGHHGYRVEREIRRVLAADGAGDFGELWNSAADRLAGQRDGLRDSARHLWTAFQAAGEIADADSRLPSRVVRHVWKKVEARKAEAFRQRAERLLLKLRDILKAEIVGSRPGRTPDRLKSGVGSSFEGAFDFDAMSRILEESKPGTKLSDERRKRIHGLIDVLERQRFYSLGAGWPEPYTFEFTSISDARKAYQDRHLEAVELAKALAVAKLEAYGDYHESVHEVIFKDFGANGLDAEALADLPFYLVYTDGRSLDPAETARLVEFLAAGLPIKVLVQTDDVLEAKTLAEGHGVALGLRARQLVETAIGLTDVFVYQASASQLFRTRKSLLRGLKYDGPALFSVFSGSNGHTGGIPAYLVAAAAMESRAFPALVYDPSAGSDWATRLSVDDNQQPDEDWPVHTFAFEDEELQARKEEIAFTLADFMAMDDRFFGHFAVVPENDRSDTMITVPEALEASLEGLPENVPFVTLVDDEGGLQRAILDNRTMLEVRRCRMMWHSLQELGGIHNSHAERLIDKERKARATELAVSAEVPMSKPVAQAVAPAVAGQPEGAEVSVTEPVKDPEAPPATGSAASVKVTAVAPAAEEINGDDPYIETPRCTTCNECTTLNDRMFAYNENKQAYIADADAGTFRQLVEAAETCQVAIIHPGKPRNPKEPGLEDLIRRAAEFE